MRVFQQVVRPPRVHGPCMHFITRGSYRGDETEGVLNIKAEPSRAEPSYERSKQAVSRGGALHPTSWNPYPPSHPSGAGIAQGHGARSGGNGDSSSVSATLRHAPSVAVIKIKQETRTDFTYNFDSSETNDKLETSTSGSHPQSAA